MVGIALDQCSFVLYDKADTDRKNGFFPGHQCDIATVEWTGFFGIPFAGIRWAADGDGDDNDRIGMEGGLSVNVLVAIETDQ